MRRFILFSIFIFFFSCAKEEADVNLEALRTNFEGSLDWVKSFGGSGIESANAIVKTSDGGFAVLGYTSSIDGDVITKTEEENDYWLLKFDTEGNLQWNRTYGGSKDDIGQSLAQTADGGYVLTGYSMSDDGDASKNQGFHDNWILKLDEKGDLEWERSYGFSGHDHSYDILQTADGGFFFTGFLDITSARADGNTEKGNGLTSHGVGEFWGTKIDQEGSVQWRGYFGGTNNDRAHAVVQAEDGGFVMTGFSESDDFDISSTNGSYDFWMVKVDPFGNLEWEHSFGGSGIEVSYDIAKTEDSGYVVVGNTFSNDGHIFQNKGASDIWLIKVDEEGNLLWERTFGGSEFDLAQAVVQSKDGGFLITGNSKSSDLDAPENNGENDIWVIKTNGNGDLVWQKSFGGSGLDFGLDILEDENGHILVVGESNSSDFNSLVTKGKIDLILLKIK